jgi:hypothetical protein
MTVPVLESWTWPWAAWTLRALYLTSGLLIALHYLPQIRLAWRHPGATATAQSLSTWSVWTVCRLVALAYAIFVIHDLLFLVVVSADIVGRLMMVVLIIRAHAIARHGVDAEGRAARGDCRDCPAGFSGPMCLGSETEPEERWKMSRVPQ